MVGDLVSPALLLNPPLSSTFLHPHSSNLLPPPFTSLLHLSPSSYPLLLLLLLLPSRLQTTSSWVQVGELRDGEGGSREVGTALGHRRQDEERRERMQWREEATKRELGRGCGNGKLRKATGPPVHMASGMAAGFIAAAVCNPIGEERREKEETARGGRSEEERRGEERRKVEE
eukprot:753925-Hanusia_phi.AAC.4